MAQERSPRPGSAPRHQAPARRNGSAPQRRPLSPEEQSRRQARLEAMRRQKEAKLRQAKLRKLRRKRLFRLSFIVSLVFVMLYWGFVAISIINRPDGTKDALPLHLFTEGKRKADHKYPVEEVCVGETKYLPVTFLEKYMAISQFGDHKTRSFLLCATGEYATFYLNTEEGVINGEHFAIKSPSFMKDDVLYLPVDFFIDKMNCFQFSKNNPTYGADVLTFLPEVEPAFVYTPVTAIEPLPYDPSYKKIPTTTAPVTSQISPNVTTPQNTPTTTTKP